MTRYSESGLEEETEISTMPPASFKGLRVSVESGLEAIVLLLYAPGREGKSGEGVNGITRLDKLLYLIVKETQLGKTLEREFDFEAYDYGPYSNRVYDIVEELKDVGIIESKPASYDSYEEISDVELMDREAAPEENATIVQGVKTQIYSLSPAGMKAGRKLFERLNREEREGLQALKSKFNRIPLRELIEYIYTRYPESSVNSKIRDKILKWSGFGRRPEMTPFVREEEDFRE